MKRFFKIFEIPKIIINEFVYDSFVWVVLGCFGISGVEKFAKK